MSSLTWCKSQLVIAITRCEKCFFECWVEGRSFYGLAVRVWKCLRSWKSLHIDTSTMGWNSHVEHGLFNLQKLLKAKDISKVRWIIQCFLDTQAMER